MYGETSESYASQGRCPLRSEANRKEGKKSSETETKSKTKTDNWISRHKCKTEACLGERGVASATVLTTLQAKQISIIEKDYEDEC